MTRADDQRIADILDAASELAAIVNLGVDQFRTESILQRAAERLLEIIGEAASALGDDTKARHPDVPWTDVARMRIVLAHHYHRVDPDQVWVIAREEVPALVRALSTGGGKRPD